MLYGFRVGQIHGQFERLRRALRQVDELEELPILAPVIKLSAICDLASFLPPIANRRELRLRGRAALPKIEKDRLARLRPQARQRRHRTVRVADVLAVGDKVVVLLDDRPRFFVAVGVRDFVVNRIGAEVDEPAHFVPFLGKAGGAGNVEHRIGVREKLLRLGPAQPKPCAVAVAPAIGPAILQAEALADPR